MAEGGAEGHLAFCDSLDPQRDSQGDRSLPLAVSGPLLVVVEVPAEAAVVVVREREDHDVAHFDARAVVNR